MEATVGTNYNA